MRESHKVKDWHRDAAERLLANRVPGPSATMAIIANIIADTDPENYFRNIFKIGQVWRDPDNEQWKVLEFSESGEHTYITWEKRSTGLKTLLEVNEAISLAHCGGWVLVADTVSISEARKECIAHLHDMEARRLAANETSDSD